MKQSSKSFFVRKHNKKLLKWLSTLTALNRECTEKANEWRLLGCLSQGDIWEAKKAYKNALASNKKIVSMDT